MKNYFLHSTFIVSFIVFGLGMSICFCAQIFANEFTKIEASSDSDEVMRQNLAQLAKPHEHISQLLRLCSQIVLPSVVHIETKQVRPQKQGKNVGRSAQMEISESGNGIVAEIEGRKIIITNRHVVDGFDLDAITILTADRQIIVPTRIRSSEEYDLAVIETETSETSPTNLPKSICWGDSDQVETGDLILTAGSPFGLAQSVSIGIVSATNRRQIPSAGGEPPKVPFIQIDAAVNPGSSGGPLVNLRGEMIGLVTAIATQGGGHEGVAFVMPSKTVRRVATQLVRDGIVHKPICGLELDPTFSAKIRKELGISRQIGTRIKRVVPNSPAALSDLRVGDVIMSFEKIVIEDDLHFVILLSESEIGKPISLQILREGKIVPVSVSPCDAQ
ncbi:MAG: S1C family serine protease [Thermoguttaceae bacterium]